MSPNAIGIAYAIGAAGLGLWSVVRFPARGPQSLRGAVLVVAAAYALLLATGPLGTVAVSVGGSATMLLAVLLPFLTLAFWSAAHLVRVGVERIAPYRR